VCSHIDTISEFAEPLAITDGRVQVYHPIQSIESDYVVASGFGEFWGWSVRLRVCTVSP